MKKRKFIFGGLAGLMFLTFVAVNLSVSQSYDKHGIAQLSLKELVAKAQWGGEVTEDYFMFSENCVDQYPDCYISGQCCYPAPGWECDISSEEDCSLLCW